MEEFKGKVYKIEPIKKVSEKFSIQQMILEVEYLSQTGSWVNYYPIQASNRNLKLLEGIYEGMDVTATVAVQGRKFNRKDTGEEGFMVTLNLLRLDSPKTNKRFAPNGDPLDEHYEDGKLQSSELDESMQDNKDEFSSKENEEDDLPF
jgi:hypothetical protein